MPILSLLAKLGLDKTGFDAGMDSANKSVQKFGAGLKSQLAGAFGAAAATSFVKSIIDTGGQIKDLSDRLGISTKDVQEFGMAAKLGGQDVGVFASAVEKVRLAMVRGVSEGKNPLAVFGITMQELRSGDAAGILRRLSVELENFAGSADQTRALADVFGARGMGAVVNMLRELGSASREPIFSEREVELLDRAGDSLTKLWSRLKVFGAGLIIHPENPLQKNASGGVSGAKGSPVEGIVAQAEEAEKAQKKLADVQQKTAEILERNRISQLTDEERLNELIEERTELVRQLQFALTEEATAGIQLKIAQNQASLIQASGKTQLPKEAQSGSAFRVGESSFGRIGAFTGAASQAAMPAGVREQLAELNQIKQALVFKGIIVKDVKP